MEPPDRGLAVNLAREPVPQREPLSTAFSRRWGLAASAVPGEEDVFLHPDGRPPEDRIVRRLTTLLPAPPRFRPVTPEAWEAAVDREGGRTVWNDGEPDDDPERERHALDRLAREAPIVGLVDDICRKGIAAGASDIHIEARRTDVAVRFRVDGVLKVAAVLGKAQFWGLSSRIKIMAGLNIMERRQPQDGRLTLDLGFERVDLRVSILPSNWGESVVLRILKRGFSPKGLADLGVGPREEAFLRRVCARPQGLFLVTGPTGSGKSTTLHTLLEHLKGPEIKIICLEDPVERVLDGTTQIQVNDALGLGFAELLRRVLRHDPNVLMIGEIRDSESAELAVRAALTGHLVFSTLHTVDAVAALGRLKDLGVADSLISGILEGVVAQRLVRTLCPHCSTVRPATARDAAAFPPSLSLPSRLPVAVGCDRCGGEGFHGRAAVWDFFPLEPDLRKALAAGAAEAELRQLKESLGWPGLAAGGLELIRQGRTTVEELVREVSLS